jgi:triphosphatase
VRRYSKALRALQERLGAVSDVLMALQAFAQRAPADPQAMFALGWLAARREALIAAAAPELKAFAKVGRFWKKRG